MELSANFTLAAYIKSNTATRLDIDNTPNEKHLESAVKLFKNVIQPVRDKFGPTRLSSGYRCAQLNTAVGGSKKSQHCKGEAVDFEVYGTDNREVVEWVIDNLDFDQIILEFYDESDMNSGWIHCSYVSDQYNRNNVLRAVKENGRTKYLKGL